MKIFSSDHRFEINFNSLTRHEVKCNEVESTSLWRVSLYIQSIDMDAASTEILQCILQINTFLKQGSIV
jgi:hypothetical protein